MPLIDDGQYSYRSYDPTDKDTNRIDVPPEEIDYVNPHDTISPSGDSTTARKANYTYMDYVKNNYDSISSAPSVGETKLLVIPVWFTESSSYIHSSKKETVRNDIEKTYFGTDSETGWKSVKSFYEEESHGALTVSGTVSDWYNCGDSISMYAKDDNTVSKTKSLVNRATNWYFANNTSDSRSNYDQDHDGYLDGVMIIYGIPDYKSMRNDRYENLWAYCYWMADSTAKNPLSPGLNVFFWASYDYMYGSNLASSRTGSSRCAGGDTRYCHVDAHTYIHEMGHMFGLDDYYDYSDHNYRPAGTFSMQDHNIGGHDPYSSFALGWGKAYIPTETVTINLKPFVETGEMIILSPKFNANNSPFDEYLILEYYTPTGLNQFDTTYAYSNEYPKGSSERGIRLWHVDARLLYTTDGRVRSSQITTNPHIENKQVTQLMTNTYDDGTEETQAYLSPLGVNYANCNLLQLIRNDTRATYKPNDHFSTSSLFREGAEFTMNSFKNQFVNSGKLNSYKDLGYSFRVNSITAETLSVTITKL